MLLISDLNSEATCLSVLCFYTIIFWNSELNYVWHHLDYLVDILLNNFLLQYSHFLSLLLLTKISLKLLNFDSSYNCQPSSKKKVLHLFAVGILMKGSSDTFLNVRFLLIFN